MSNNCVTEEMMLNYAPSLAGIKKLPQGKRPENFSFYSFEWMRDKGMGDDPRNWRTMKLVGCVFRAAKAGPNKGQFTMPVEGTERTVYVDRTEIARAQRALEKTKGKQP